jgi:hypothetical protein
MAATPPPDPVVLVDVDDLAEADLDADLAERLEADGRVLQRPDAAGASADEARRLTTGTDPRPTTGTDPRPTAADAVSLAEAIRRGGAAAAAVHVLGPRAAVLAG